jgi:outer membrane protein
VRNAYWDLVFAIQSVDAAKTSLGIADKLVADNKVRVEVGTLAPIDVISAQSQAALSRRTLVSAQGTLKSAELTLKSLIVSNTQDRLWTATINPTDKNVTLTPESIDLEGAIRHALDVRTDVVSARKNMEISDINLRYQKNQMLPSLSASATYSTNGTGGTRVRGTGVTTPIPGGYFDALRILGRQDNPTWNFSLNFSYPIGQSSQDANYARSKIQYQQSQASLRSLELRVATAITNAAMTLQSNLEQVQAAGVARDLAQKKLEAAQSKFEVGMAVNFDVIQAQRDLDDAKNSELSAILAYRRAVVNFKLLQETGSSSGSSAPSSSSSSGG